MINLAWGGHTNGSIDTALLVDVTGRGDYLEPTAAARWLALSAACLRATGVLLTAAPGSSANRPVSIQETFYTAYRKYLAGGPYAPVAAVPGTSNHGWARAIDITGYEGNTAWVSPRTGKRYSVNITVWNWLQAHAAEYGYDWATGDSSGEPWHWESLTTPGTTVAGGAGTPILNRTDDDEMLSPEAQKWMLDTFATKSDVRRENRGRLYYCPTPPTGLPQFVVIFINRNPGAGNVLYCNAGEAQAANWANLYGQTADSVAQAKAVPDTKEQFQTRINLALGIDSAFKNALAK